MKSDDIYDGQNTTDKDIFTMIICSVCKKKKKRKKKEESQMSYKSM